MKSKSTKSSKSTIKNNGRKKKGGEKRKGASDILMDMIYKNSIRNEGDKDNYEAIKAQFNKINYGEIPEWAQEAGDDGDIILPKFTANDSFFYKSILEQNEKFKSLPSSEKSAFTSEVMRFQEFPQDIYWRIKECPYNNCIRTNPVHIFAQHKYKLTHPATIISMYMYEN
jgi:hypothetical protein